MTITKTLTFLTLITIMTTHVAGMSRTQSITHQTQLSRKNLRVHMFSPSVSNQLSTAIRNKIISNMATFSDQQFAQQLKEDLGQEKDSERKLKKISVQSAEELFRIFGLKGIKCDNNNDGVITKEELQCLNFIWKYYVPLDSQLEN